MPESSAGTYVSLAGTEIVNNTRVLKYLQNGLGPASLTVHCDDGHCGNCENIFDLLGCFPEEVVVGEQCVDLSGGDGDSLSTPDTAAISLQGTDEFLRLTGHTGTYASTPDSAALSITGDIDIRVRVALDDWTPADNDRLVNKWETAGNQKAYTFLVLTAGTLLFGASLDGAASNNATSSVATGFADGSVHWVRATRVAATGVVQFFTSDDGVTWVQLGTDQATVAGNIADTSNVVRIGAGENGTSEMLTGNVYYAEIRNGINGTIVANPDFTTTPWTIGDIAPTARADTSGNTWTLNGFASIVAAAERRSLRLSGAASTFVITPDSAGVSVTGDIDIRAKVAHDDWTPATFKAMVFKGNSYHFYLTTSGALFYTWFSGTVGTSKTSTVVTGVADGAIKWVRVTHDVDNGAGGNDVKFYTSNDGVTWVQLGATLTTAGVTTIDDSTASLLTGGDGSASQNVAGNLFYAEVRNGIDGTIVANPNFQQRPWDVGETGGATGADAAGNTWTLNGAGAVIQRAFASDLDVRIKLAMDDWTPATNQTLVAKRVFSTNNRSWRFYIASGGFPVFQASLNGVSESLATVPAPGFSDGVANWIRVAWRASDGRTQFFISTDGVNWAQLGGDQTVNISAIYDSTAPLEIGSRENGTLELLAGNVYYVEVQNTTEGDTVALFDPPDTVAPGPQDPSTSGVFTINGSSWAWCENEDEFPFFPFVGPTDYTDPVSDEAPWFTPSIPESAEFLGLYVDEFIGLDSPFTRDVVESVGNGGVLTRSRLRTRTMTWRGFLFGGTCCATYYGLRWLTRTLSRFNVQCKDCFGDDMELLICCPCTDNLDTESPFRLVKGVGLLEGPIIQSQRRTVSSSCTRSGCNGSCIIEVEFTMVATQPYLYSPPIPVYDCVALEPMPVVTDAASACPPFNCSDAFYSALCADPELPPEPVYTNSCAELVDNQLGPAMYLTVPRSLWPELEEVVPVITIRNNSTFDYTGLKIGFFSSFGDNPCGDLINNNPNCDALCDELTIGFIPGLSNFYIDGRTRKMSLICDNNRTAFPGERHVNGPWSWPSFYDFGFCMEIQYIDSDTGIFVDPSFICVSLSLVPRSF